ncbi:Receptor-interacting serine/threonine-protein kinase 2 [Tulasnella sp. 417]|nr:Receptor-interacting serine/threonine-protein kinase 2 [Tulasnella sp. 417]
MILSALTYTGIVLNLGALWSALRMIDILGKMHPLNAQYDADLDISRLSLRSNTQTSTHDVTASYGLRGIWTFMAWHCLISLLFGDLCIVTQVAMLVWLYEGLHSYAISLPKACGLAERTLAPMKPHIANHRHHSETTTTTTTQHDDAADLAVARGTRSSGRGKRKKPTSQERELESIPLGSKRPNRDDGPHEDALEDDNLPPAPAPQQTASSSALSSLPPTPPNLPTPPGPPPKPPFSPAPVAPSASKNDGRGNSPSELYRRADSSKQGGLPHSSGQTHLEYSAVPRGAALTEIQPELDGQLTRLPHASGRGAHSDVYQGLWTGPDGREIKVAVKVLRLPIRASDEEKPEPDRDTIHQAGLGLAYLHQRDPPICHGDIKPENILINDSMEAVLSDFGSSRVMDSLADHTGLTTTDGDHRGTLRYTAPELFNPQILGGDPSVLVTTCKTDVFAFGGVILTVSYSAKLLQD